MVFWLEAEEPTRLHRRMEFLCPFEVTVDGEVDER